MPDMTRVDVACELIAEQMAEVLLDSDQCDFEFGASHTVERLKIQLAAVSAAWDIPTRVRCAFMGIPREEWCV